MSLSPLIAPPLSLELAAKNVNAMPSRISEIILLWTEYSLFSWNVTIHAGMKNWSLILVFITLNSRKVKAPPASCLFCWMPCTPTIWTKQSHPSMLKEKHIIHQVYLALAPWNALNGHSRNLSTRGLIFQT